LEGLGDRLKKARGRVPQKEFAESLGIHLNTYRNYESGERSPDADFLGSVCSVYKVSPAWLLTGIGSMMVESGEEKKEGETFKISEMVEATVRILESETVYRSALASNIRAFDKAVQMEGKMQGIEEEMRKMRQEAAERDAAAAERMDRMEKLILSLGGQVPEKRDPAANA
jgi:transcriptional regulator with XRE-family HTH domain